MHRFRFRGFRTVTWLLLLNCGSTRTPGRTPARPSPRHPTPVATPAATAGGTASEPDEPTECQDLELCDFCGSWEARTAYGRGLDLPEGWVALEIDRRGAEVLYRTYCSEDHMHLDLAGPLPAPEPFRDEPSDRAPRTVGDRWADLALRVGMWLVGGFLLLGCVLAVRFLVGLL